MLVGSENDGSMRGHWPAAAVVLFVLGVGSMVLLAFHFNRGITVAGLSLGAMRMILLTTWVLSWGGTALLVRRARSRKAASRRSPTRRE